MWDAFAQFGIGVGANGNEVPLAITESFTEPSECTAPPANTPPTVTITSPGGGDGVAGLVGSFLRHCD